MAPSTWLYRHDELIIGRPYAIDVDADGWLWEGTAHNRLMGHHLNTAELRVLDVPEMEGAVVFSVFAWQGKLLLEMGTVPFYLVLDPHTGRCQRHELPTTPAAGTAGGAKPITWYGTRLPANRLLLYDRGQGNALILDAPDAKPEVYHCPYGGDFGVGHLCSDGLIYVFLTDPARLVRFDPARAPGKARFLDERALPWPEGGISGRFEHGGILYCADSAGGRFLPLELATLKWLDPIPHPDHAKVFGFIGAAFEFQGKGYCSLSTYAARSRLDTRTGKIIIPEGGPPTVDGLPPRFMEKFLIFDPSRPAAQAFEYLEAPPQLDGVPLLCYGWSDAKRFAITGVVLPFGEPGVAGPEPGPWIILQNQSATAEPRLGPFDFNFDRDAHLRRYRRSYPREHSLYLPEPPHSPPTVNMHGPATAYPPGYDAQLSRRAAKTDAKTYWQQVVRRLCPADSDAATRTRLILEHVQHQIYYNPIQAPRTFDPIAIHEAHDGRCGHGVGITLELAQAAGVQARRVELQNHVVAEAFYDGSWHIADALFFGANQPARDGRVLSVDELKADPWFADSYPQPCFAYDPELLLSADGFQVLGYVFGPWGSEPYYSYYLGAPKEQPPTLPVLLPAARLGGQRMRLAWSPSVRAGGGAIEYDVRVRADRACRQELFRWSGAETSVTYKVPEMNRMYFLELRAMDEHRLKNPGTWYPAARSNFVLVPEGQYGWYGVL